MGRDQQGAGMSVRADRDFVGTKSFLRRWVSPITASAVLLTLTTAFVWMIDAPLQHDHLIFIYLVPTALYAFMFFGQSFPKSEASREGAICRALIRLIVA